MSGAQSPPVTSEASPDAVATPPEAPVKAKMARAKFDSMFVIAVMSAVAAIISAIGGWRAADSASESNRINLEAFTNSQRPFVVMTKLDVRPEDGANGFTRWRFTPTWSNSGNTPTRNLVINLRCEFWPKSVLDESWRIVEPSRGNSRNLIGPKLDAQIGNCSLGDIAMREMLAGKRVMYVIGRADYVDAFSKRREAYVTEFCSEIRVTGTLDDHGKAVQPMNVSSTLCDDLNCADEECKQQRLLRRGAQIAATANSKGIPPPPPGFKIIEE